ncbi:MAG: hypothetical protein P4L76_01425 [Beijerinckiaceae bacterium]|nr:hypothetical protein [Beijerinckiaceae bacterium]
MRFALGLIVGIALTIGGAYLIDTMYSAPGPDQKEAARMVNWGVVNGNLRALSTSVQDGWARLTGHAH